jgi:hypothetical protein
LNAKKCQKKKPTTSQLSVCDAWVIYHAKKSINISHCMNRKKE